jgi:hypothetical protein
MIVVSVQMMSRGKMIVGSEGLFNLASLALWCRCHSRSVCDCSRHHLSDVSYAGP